jgi:hypothetical protein
MQSIVNQPSRSHGYSGTPRLHSQTDFDIAAKGPGVTQMNEAAAGGRLQ